MSMGGKLITSTSKLISYLFQAHADMEFSFVDRDKMMRYRGGGVGHTETQEYNYCLLQQGTQRGYSIHDGDDDDDDDDQDQDEDDSNSDSDSENTSTASEKSDGSHADSDSDIEQQFWDSDSGEEYETYENDEFNGYGSP